MAQKKAKNEDTTDREIVITRTIKAPRELVFDVWTNPEHVAKWWGPKGFTNTIFEMDVRPGGVWRFTMHGPDGVDYKNKNVFVEVVRPERLVYNHVTGPKFHAIVTFEEREGQTELTLRMIFNTAAMRQKVIEVFGAIEGGNQTMDRLEAYVSKM